MTLQETLASLNWGGEGYASYDGYCYMTGPETSAWNQLGYEVSDMNNKFNLMFKDQAGVLNYLTQNLESMATNPPGFGGAALSALRSSYIGTVAGGLTSALAGVRNQFATSNVAGLGSGAEVALEANLKQSATGQEAQGLNQIAIANAQQQVQQQQYALSALQGVAGQYGQGAQAYAGMATNLTGLEQQTAKGFYGQQSPLSGILGGLAGIAGNLLIPGLGTAIQGIGGLLGNQTMGNIGTAMGGWGSYGSYGSGTAPWNTPTPGAINVPTGPAIPGYSPTLGGFPAPPLSAGAFPNLPIGVVP